MSRQKLLGICRKLIMSTLKKNFLPTIFQFTKTVEWETCTHHMPHQKLHLTTVSSKYRCDKPPMRLTFCRSNFHTTRHSATCHNMQKLSQSCVALMSTLFLAFATCCEASCGRTFMCYNCCIGSLLGFKLKVSNIGSPVCDNNV